MKQKNTWRGFTLIELLVVVLIIGILAAVAVPQYQKAVEKSRLLEAIQMARTIKNANEIYYLANGQYSTSLAELDVDFDSINTNCNITNNRVVCHQYKDNSSYNFPYIVFVYSHTTENEAGAPPNTIYCYAYSKRAEKVCNAVGTLKKEYNETEIQGNRYYLN